MVISEKRHTQLYNAISDPIVDLRIKSCKGISIERMDKLLFNLEIEIYKRISKSLALQGN
jgi:hypothetical protein